MNYIGSKKRLMPFLINSIRSVLDGDERVFCDLFAGTGAVGRHFKRLGMRVIANDIQHYAFTLNRAYIGINNVPSFEGLRKREISNPLDFLNSLAPHTGFISENYSPMGNRYYFTTGNARKMDSIRSTLEGLRAIEVINEDEYYYLLASLIEAVDLVANTASVYAAFLKQFKATAIRPLHLEGIDVIQGEGEAHNEDANELLQRVKCDILYLDPPYNHRQYGSNYHLLETLSLFDEPDIEGTTGMRPYIRSAYCSRTNVSSAFRSAIAAAQTRHIFVSYNDEGLMSIGDIHEALKMRGEPRIFTTENPRYKADNGREYSKDTTQEYLHYVRVTK